MARRKFWGWGEEGSGPDEAQAGRIAETLSERLGVDDLRIAPEPRIEDVRLQDSP